MVVLIVDVCFWIENCHNVSFKLDPATSAGSAAELVTQFHNLEANQHVIGCRLPAKCPCYQASEGTPKLQ